jgi:methionyl-tRNA formyltransferase
LDGDFTPGGIIAADQMNGIVVKCGEGAVKIEELQLPGGKRMDAGAFLRETRFRACWAGDVY